MVLLNKYIQFLVLPNPPIWWRFIRFLLHWVTLPLKLTLIGGLGLFQIILNTFRTSRSFPLQPSEEQKRRYFTKVWKSLPLLVTNNKIIYVNRVPYLQKPIGTNHNSDHMCSRHSTFQFLLGRSGIFHPLVESATRRFIQIPYLLRGYKWNQYDGEVQYNNQTTSGDMLCGLNLAILTTKNPDLEDDYVELVDQIIQNDYSLLEGQNPGKEYELDTLWQKLYKQAYCRPENVFMKSLRGMWQPGIETAGAQALTILSALKLMGYKLNYRHAQAAYKKLFWFYGYGILSIFPTAYISSNRGYFNDHNCMISLYVLAKLSTNKFEKYLWKFCMWYVWSLSKHWYNGYFTGLVKECYPELISDSYIEKCRAFLYENEPRTYGWDNGSPYIIEKVTPVTYNELPEDEFSPDISHNQKIVGGNQIRTGLGFIASAMLLEKSDYFKEIIQGEI
jgi:hypothetical protein